MQCIPTGIDFESVEYPAKSASCNKPTFVFTGFVSDMTTLPMIRSALKITYQSHLFVERSVRCCDSSRHCVDSPSHVCSTRCVHGTRSSWHFVRTQQPSHPRVQNHLSQTDDRPDRVYFRQLIHGCVCRVTRSFHALFCMSLHVVTQRRNFSFVCLICLDINSVSLAAILANRSLLDFTFDSFVIDQSRGLQKMGTQVWSPNMQCTAFHQILTLKLPCIQQNRRLGTNLACVHWLCLQHDQIADDPRWTWDSLSVSPTFCHTLRSSSRQLELMH